MALQSRHPDIVQALGAPSAGKGKVTPTPTPSQSVDSRRSRGRRYGHLYVEVQLNGHAVKMEVDPSVDLVTLSSETAKALGIAVAPSDYNGTTETDGGTVKTATMILPDVRVGGIAMTDVRGLVINNGDDAPNLLGQSFLSRLSAFERKPGQLILKR